jgi:hypothetical protein
MTKSPMAVVSNICISCWQFLEFLASTVIETSLLLETRLYDSLHGVDSIPKRDFYLGNTGQLYRQRSVYVQLFKR